MMSDFNFMVPQQLKSYALIFQKIIFNAFYNKSTKMV